MQQADYDPVDRLNSLSEYTKRDAGASYEDTYVHVWAKVKGKTPTLTVRVGGKQEKREFESTDDLNEAFDNLVQKYDLIEEQ